ncbi:MAG: hypothetical protein HQ465_18410 [Rhodospirillales bacterium]|nr:hypothetical protein [Rhodospirillales bacterium]
MNRRSFLGALPILAAAPAFAQQLPAIRTVTLAPGPGATNVTGTLADTKARGLYYVPGQAGQTMNIAVASPGNNVVFQVWEPGTAVRTNADGTLALDGKPLHDAGPTDEPAAWIGALPKPGPYLLIVYSRRDAASYKLAISVTAQ